MDFPLASESPAPTSSSSSATADLKSDPLKTLELKPKVIDALSRVFDPEIPVNIYELGLIYDIIVDEHAVVGIRMTLTSPACPAAQILPGQVADEIRKIAGVSEAKVDVVWEPPWDKDKMSEAAKLQLGLW
jgi:FeS assembly SUF system protein